MNEKKVREAIDELKSLICVRKRTLAELPTSARKNSLYSCRRKQSMKMDLVIMVLQGIEWRNALLATGGTTAMKELYTA